MRNKLGQWVPGTSGNPNGRSAESYSVSDMAKPFTEEALEKVVRILREGRPREQLEAAKILLEKAWGKTPVSVEFSKKEEVRPTIIIGYNQPPSSHQFTTSSMQQIINNEEQGASLILGCSGEGGGE